jgi:hypothetical protein
MQTKGDGEQSKSTLIDRYVAFSVDFGYGCGHEKDIKRQSLRPKSYPLKRPVKRGIKLSEIVCQPSDIVHVASNSSRERY